MNIFRRTCCPPSDDYLTLDGTYTCKGCDQRWVFADGWQPQTWRRGPSLHGRWVKAKRS